MDLSQSPNRNFILMGIIGFFLVRVAIGYWASRKVLTAADYIVAGRGLPIYMTASSIMATWFAAETLMGASSSAYESGFHGVIFDPFGAVLCLIVSGMFFIRLMRRARYLTVVDFFEKRFGREVSAVGSFVQIVAYLVWTAAQFVAGGHVVHSLMGWDLWIGIVVIGVIVTAYTTLGGMLADTLLDFIQMFFTAGGITAVFLYLLHEVGGWEGMLAHNGSRNVSEPYALLPIGVDSSYLGYKGWTAWSYWLSAWLTIGFGSIATQDLMQRSMSARNEATSVWGSYIAALLYFIFGVMSPLIGIMYFKLDPGLHDEQLDNLLLVVSNTYLPLWLNVLFIAALTSAMMSTSDSAILAGASVVTENVLPFFTTKLSDHNKLVWTRIMVVLIGVCCMFLAVQIAETYKLAMMAWSVLLVGMFAPFAFGMYWKSANRSGALASSIGGIATWCLAGWLYFPQTTLVNTNDGSTNWSDAIWDAVYLGSLPALSVSVLMMVVMSMATKHWDKPLPLTDVDGNPLPMKNRLGFVPFRDIFRDEPVPAAVTTADSSAS